MNRKLLMAPLFFLLLAELQAFDLMEPESFLGLGISDLFGADTIPSEIFPQRGLESDEDNVVFYYSGGFYLFLFRNRVWQVRYDRNSSRLPLDLSMGDGRSSLLSSFLDRGFIPLLSDSDSVTFELKESPWPVRMKLFFFDDKLDDLYIYRADF